MSYEQIFDESYERVKRITKQNNSFFDRFYVNFFQSSPEIALYFAHTDMNQQKQVLEKSFYSLFIFYATKNANDYLMEIATQHDKHHLNIRPELYDFWLESLIKTVREYDPQFCTEIELSWRVVLSVGITYMKFKFDQYYDTLAD